MRMKLTNPIGQNTSDKVTIGTHTLQTTYKTTMKPVFGINYTQFPQNAKKFELSV